MASTEGLAGVVERCPMRPDYNPLAPETIVDPIKAVRSIAEEDRVFFSPACSWWTVSRYEDVRTVLGDTKRFSSAAVLGRDALSENVREIAPDGEVDLEPGLVNTDPPVHDRVRQLANKAFSPSVVEARRPRIEQITHDLLDKVVPVGRCDIVADFAVSLPILVFAEVLGIPREREGLIQRGSSAHVRIRSAPLEGEEELATWHAYQELTDYLGELIAERRRDPQDDYTTRLIQARDGEHAMFDDAEVRTLIWQIIPAGSETTRHLIASLVLRLTQDPALAGRLRNHPELIPAFVEEGLRHSGSAKGLMRVTTEDVELGGVLIPKGDLVHVYFAGANHDAAVFERPEEFDIERDSPRPHVAFGHGKHFCLGAPLARAETQIAIRAIVDRMPNLRRADEQPLQWLLSPFVFGLKGLDVCWDV